MSAALARLQPTYCVSARAIRSKIPLAHDAATRPEDNRIDDGYRGLKPWQSRSDEASLGRLVRWQGAREGNMNSMRSTALQARLFAGCLLFAFSSYPATAQTTLTDLKVPLPKEDSAAGDRFVLRTPGEPAHPADGTWGYDFKTGDFKH